MVGLVKQQTMFTEQNSVEYFVIKALTGVELPYSTVARESTASL
jgi:hypothetical protein